MLQAKYMPRYMSRSERHADLKIYLDRRRFAGLFAGLSRHIGLKGIL